jgi:hypothetical protein
MLMHVPEATVILPRFLTFTSIPRLITYFKIKIKNNKPPMSPLARPGYYPFHAQDDTQVHNKTKPDSRQRILLPLNASSSLFLSSINQGQSCQS